MLVGYKSFNKGLVNNYGDAFKVKGIYTARGIIKAGNNGNGFHMCKNMEDTFRYFHELGDFDVCLVKGKGKHDYRYDDYYDYEMYAYQTMEILKVLTREEIINYGLNLNDDRFLKFISTIKLNDEEIKLFDKKFADQERNLCHIEYYQKGNEKAYIKRLR